MRCAEGEGGRLRLRLAGSIGAAVDDARAGGISGAVG
jgi:hypothetical protein